MEQIQILEYTFSGSNIQILCYCLNPPCAFYKVTACDAKWEEQSPWPKRDKFKKLFRGLGNLKWKLKKGLKFQTSLLLLIGALVSPEEVTVFWHTVIYLHCFMVPPLVCEKGRNPPQNCPADSWYWVLFLCVSFVSVTRLGIKYFQTHTHFRIWGLGLRLRWNTVFLAWHKVWLWLSQGTKVETEQRCSIKTCGQRMISF